MEDETIDLQCFKCGEFWTMLLAVADEHGLDDNNFVCEFCEQDILTDIC